MKAISREVKDEIRKVVECELAYTLELDLNSIKRTLEEEYKRRFVSNIMLKVLVDQVLDEIIYVDIEE